MASTDLYTLVSPMSQIGGREVYEFIDGDLVDDDIQEMVTISLFTWRRALDSDPVPEGASRYGWFADPEMGSLLYLLLNEVISVETLARAKSYVLEALEWMVEDKILERVDALATRTSDHRMLLDIGLKPPRAPEKRLRYAYLTAEAA